MRLARTGLAAALAASLWGAALFGADAARAADPVKIRLSYVVPISNWASMLVEKKDLAKHLGKSYQLAITRFAGTPPMITALAAGELEIADLTYPTLPIAIENAGMDDLRVIADEFQDGNAGFYSNEFMVLADGPINEWRTSRARPSPPTRLAARWISPCGPCCANTALRTGATTPS